ncbi:IS982 family transposase [Spirosoma validum]|uniref:IS982 family transposase n=1 Tax=Spirosoma validum TaxID=2771355 RepID=A0A927AYW9_9BACT|nr:IS982 family transposase [Spirosoma validum]
MKKYWQFTAASAVRFLDDFFLETNHPGSIKPQAKPKVPDSIVLTTAIISARFFGGNQASAMLYMTDKQGIGMLEKSAFNRRLHRLAHTLSALFYYLADFFKALNLSSQHVIDSFPVPVCDNIRISRSRLVKGEEYRGKIASKRRFFYGFRVQVVTTSTKQPVQFFVLPGSYADVTALQLMHLHLPMGSEVFGDSAYTDYKQEELYADGEQIYLQIQRKSNSHRVDPIWVAAYKKMRRQAIEQAFSQVKLRFPQKIHAVTEAGFLIKLVLFLLAYTLETNLYHTT